MYGKKLMTFFPTTTIIDVMKFDNSHSRVRSKEVFYSIKVTPPQAEITLLMTEAAPTQAVGLCLATFTIRDGYT